MTLAISSRCFLAIALSCASVKASPRAPDEKPNIIMLFVDDLGYGDTGFNGHPTAMTPNIDALARGGKRLTQWYSGCPVCSGSRAALMTGRQWTRVGVPGVFGPAVSAGLPLNETTIAEHLKTAGYSTAAVGKWHLGQRRAYLPHNRGFDHYLGIPFSDDMGQGRASACNNKELGVPCKEGLTDDEWMKEHYAKMDYVSDDEVDSDKDPGAAWTPLVHQSDGVTTVLEQPVDFTFLAKKYNKFAIDFVKNKSDSPFFLYMPFSHVHTTAGNMPHKQYAGCDWKNTSRRGPFGDALAEVDWIVGNVHQALKDAGIEENTLILFTGDNGPWLIQGLSGGSTGLLDGRYSGYWNVGKGSTWEGGIREAAFAYWKGKITPASRTAEVVSSLDLFPTLSALAGASLPAKRVYDGRDMSDVLFKEGGRSKHTFLFFYGGCGGKRVPSSVRYGKWKAHWCTGPGLGGCTNCKKINYDTPLLFDVEKDPSEAQPVSTSSGEGEEVIEAIQAAYKTEVATFTRQKLIPEPDEKGEGPGHYAVCCDLAKKCKCNGSPPSPSPPSICPGPKCPSVPAANYVGCFKDKGDKKKDCDFPYMVTGQCPGKKKVNPDPAMSVELCNARCLEAGQNFSYFAVQFGGHGCFCGTEYGKWGPTSQKSDCSSPCPGNATESCGGSNANAVFKLEAPDAAQLV